MSPVDGCTAFPTSDETLTKWTGKIVGPDDGPYDGLIFKLAITFPDDFPMKPPHLQFDDGVCFHPNVALDSGEICLGSSPVPVSLSDQIGRAHV